MRALVIDPDRRLTGRLTAELAREGFAVEAVTEAATAVRLARTARPDVMVLTGQRPNTPSGPPLARDGIEICRQLRAASPAYLVIVGEPDVLAAFAAGADDCLAETSSPRELVARVKAMLRRPRTRGELPGTLAGTLPGSRCFGDLWLDPLGREVRVAGRPVQLTPREFEVLAALAARPRTAFSRRQLVARVWGAGSGADDHVVDVHVANLRRKLGDDPANPRYVRTVRGVGYRMGPGTDQSQACPVSSSYASM